MCGALAQTSAHAHLTIRRTLAGNSGSRSLATLAHARWQLWLTLAGNSGSRSLATLAHARWQLWLTLAGNPGSRSPATLAHARWQLWLTLTSNPAHAHKQPGSRSQATRLTLTSNPAHARRQPGSRLPQSLADANLQYRPALAGSSGRTPEPSVDSPCLVRYSMSANRTYVWQPPRMVILPVVMPVVINLARPWYPWSCGQ